MYQNMSIIIEDSDCKICTHFGVCQHKQDFIEFQDKLLSVEKPLLSPFKVDIRCMHYQKSAQRQDGLFTR